MENSKANHKPDGTIFTFAASQNARPSVKNHRRSVFQGLSLRPLTLGQAPNSSNSQENDEGPQDWLGAEIQHLDPSEESEAANIIPGSLPYSGFGTTGPTPVP